MKSLAPKLQLSNVLNDHGLELAADLLAEDLVQLEEGTVGNRKVFDAWREERLACNKYKESITKTEFL